MLQSALDAITYGAYRKGEPHGSPFVIQVMFPTRLSVIKKRAIRLALSI